MIGGTRAQFTLHSWYEEVTGTPRCCFVRSFLALAGSFSITTFPAPPFSVATVFEPSVWMINWVFRLSAFVVRLLDSSPVRTEGGRYLLAILAGYCQGSRSQS